jgi:hypothetical protein
MHLIGATIILLHCQLLNITSNVIRCSTISVKRWIKMIRCRYYIFRFLRARVILVEAISAPKSGMAQLPTHLTLVIFIRVVGITRATVTSIVATLTTTVFLVAATVLLLVVIAMD